MEEVKSSLQVSGLSYWISGDAFSKGDPEVWVHTCVHACVCACAFVCRRAVGIGHRFDW